MLTWMETLLQDTRIAFRLMRRSPALTGIALLSIALSVGATAVFCTAVKAVLLCLIEFKPEDAEPIAETRPELSLSLGYLPTNAVTSGANVQLVKIDLVFPAGNPLV